MCIILTLNVLELQLMKCTSSNILSRLLLKNCNVINYKISENQFPIFSISDFKGPRIIISITKY